MVHKKSMGWQPPQQDFDRQRHCICGVLSGGKVSESRADCVSMICDTVSNSLMKREYNSLITEQYDQF